MAIYLGTFFLSFLLCWAGEKIIKQSPNKNLGIIFLILSVLVVCILAGLRDKTVGSDTFAYTTYFVEWAKKFHSFRGFMKFYNTAYEPGFNLFGFVIAKIFNYNYHWFLFCCALVIYGFVMRTFYYYSSICSMSMAWMFFLMLNCTEALNITRQYMALAIATYAFIFAYENKNRNFFLWTLIAISFHVSAVINFFVFFVYKRMKKNNTRRFKIITTTILVASILLANVIFRLLSIIPFISTKIAGMISTGFDFQMNPFLIRLPFLILLLVDRLRFDDMRNNSGRVNATCYTPLKGTIVPDASLGEFFIFMTFMEMIVAQYRMVSESLYRLVVFFMAVRYVSYSRIVNVSPLTGNRTILKIFSYIFMFVVFVYWTAGINSGLIYPYTSEILGIAK